MSNKCDFNTATSNPVAKLLRGLARNKKQLEAIEFSLEMIEALAPTFFIEYASRSVHDAKEGGLGAHTGKVFNILHNLVFSGAYPTLNSAINEEALIIGAIVHDIGKTMEYNKGSNGEYHYVSHNILGVEIITQYKDKIIQFYGEDTYYRIMAVIGQHHGEFGERPQTIEAYLVHLADMMEARVQVLEEELEATLVEEYERDVKPTTVSSKYIPFRLSVGNLFGKKPKCD